MLIVVCYIAIVVVRELLRDQVPGHMGIIRLHDWPTTELFHHNNCIRALRICHVVIGEGVYHCMRLEQKSGREVVGVAMQDYTQRR